MDYYQQYHSPIGTLILVSDGKSLIGLWFKDCHPKHKQMILKSLPIFTEVKKWLDSYFHGNQLVINFPINLTGTPFQLKVWKTIQGIPYGEAVTYKDIASKVGTNSSRAVGLALSKNPVLIVIPCHRIIGSNHQLTGYAGGIKNKVWLLNWEKKNLHPA